MNQLLLSVFLLNILAFCVNAQQNYSGISGLDCNSDGGRGASSGFRYTCNSQRRTSCQAFLIYKSQPPFNSVSKISDLMSSDRAELARINNVSELSMFPTNKEVIVPVSCSCLGQYYQANTTFHVSSIYGTYYSMAYDAYQGLSTCASLKLANPHGENDLMLGTELLVPLLCACPTSNQTATGIKYLVTYSLSSGQDIDSIGERFNVSLESILEANNLPEDPTIYSSTTILIPMTTEPSSSQTITINKDQDQPVLPSTPASNPKSSGSKRKVVVESIGVAAASSLLVLAIILFSVFLVSKKRKEGALQSDSRRENSKVLPAEDLRVEIASFEQVLRVFTFEEIKKATENFSSKYRIQGSVYHGGFGGEVLAVKRMRLDVSKEVRLLKTINHFNLIKLLGVCENDGCFYLVFEYMKKGSLRDWLCHQNTDQIGSWRRRIQIALDVANGLHYLHSFTKPAHVHGDIKSSNVLLNSSLRAKLANFSLARAAVKETSSVAQTRSVVGTRGYMAPEYIEAGLVTPKIDVYAFGVVLLELISGRDAIIAQDGREIQLSTVFISAMNGEKAEAELVSFIDPRLREKNGTEFALRLAQISLVCLTKEPSKRPSMEEVVSLLSKIRKDLLKWESSDADSI